MHAMCLVIIHTDHFKNTATDNRSEQIKVLLFRVELIGFGYLGKNNIAGELPVVGCSMHNAEAIQCAIRFNVFIVKEIYIECRLIKFDLTG